MCLLFLSSIFQSLFFIDYVVCMFSSDFKIKLTSSKNFLCQLQYWDHLDQNLFHFIQYLMKIWHKNCAIIINCWTILFIVLHMILDLFNIDCITFFKTCSNLFNAWCNQVKLLHHYFKQFRTFFNYDAIKTNYCITFINVFKTTFYLFKRWCN